MICRRADQDNSLQLIDMLTMLALLDLIVWGRKNGAAETALVLPRRVSTERERLIAEVREWVDISDWSKQ